MVFIDISACIFSIAQCPFFGRLKHRLAFSKYWFSIYICTIHRDFRRTEHSWIFTVSFNKSIWKHQEKHCFIGNCNILLLWNTSSNQFQQRIIRGIVTSLFCHFYWCHVWGFTYNHKTNLSLNHHPLHY